MAAAALKRLLPHPVKHPILACSQLVWDLRGMPAQSRGDMALMREVLRSAGGHTVRVFEWGSGRSTLYYSKYLASLGRSFTWTAMDNSRLWHEKTQKKIEQVGLRDSVQVFCSEFPAFWEVPGYSYKNQIPPQPLLDDPNVAEYVDAPRSAPQRFDLIFVDGRFRRRCLITASEVLAPGGIVILHDAQRSHYHSSLSAYPQVQFLETGLFTGTRQMSTIALCGMDSDSMIAPLAKKYRVSG